MNLKVESSELEFQELQRKRIKEIMDAKAKILAETTAKAKKLQFYYVILELVLGIAGYLVVGFMVSWWLVLGLFLIHWSSNLSRQRVIYQNKKNLWSEIWKL
jgi:hypothetical protein